MEDTSAFAIERLTKRVKELEAERDKLLEILELDSIKRVELLARLDEFVP